MVNFKQLLIYP